MPSNNRQIKLELYKKDKRCFWCRRKTSMTQSGSSKVVQTSATIDHVYPKEDWRYSDHVSNMVIACYECNQRRDQDHKRLVPQYHQIGFFKNWFADLSFLYFLSGKI